MSDLSEGYKETMRQRTVALRIRLDLYDGAKSDSERTIYVQEIRNLCSLWQTQQTEK